jgi:hypothetical protein
MPYDIGNSFPCEVVAGVNNIISECTFKGASFKGVDEGGKEDFVLCQNNTPRRFN